MSNESLTFQAGGTLEESNFYLERSADEELPQALMRGEFCYVLAPRQMGKSSLRYRVARRLSAEQGVHCATIDLTGIGTSTSQADEWYFGIVDELARHLGDESLRTTTEDFWVEQSKLPIVQRFTRFIRDVLLAHTTGQIVVFVDEIDAVRALPFDSDDFFAAIRAVYNARPDDPEYKRLSICLLGVAQPGDLIRNEQITPFNIGTRIDLVDFERHQLDPLGPGLVQTGGDPARLLDAVYDWTQGHPYMVLTICAELVPSHAVPLPLAPGQESQHVARQVEKLFFQRSQQRNPNLDYAEKCFQRGDANPRVAKMLALYARLVRGERVAADGRDPIQGAILLTGMAAPRRTDSGPILKVRNRIFATVFDAAWVKTQQSERFLSEPLTRWLESGRNDDFVLRGEALREAERWVDQRIDTTSEEQEFLRACWRVHSAEESVRAEGAVQSARIAQVEAEAAQAKANAERLERERAEAQALAEKTERERAETQTLAEKAERERAMAIAQAQLRSRANRFLGLLVVTLLVALAVVFALYRQSRREEKAKSAALEEVKRSAAKAETMAQAERGARAKALAQLPGDVDALRVGLQAVNGSRWTTATPTAQVIDGLTSAAQARGYPLFAPWRHEKPVYTVTFSPDGSRVVTASYDGTAGLWDAKTGASLLSLKGHTKSVRAASFSPDGSRVVTASYDGTARLWDVKTGASLLSLKGHT
ncbi:MAG TPA: AAA-like domain-containing protein, partial [Pseudomonadota bacterium]|nr:AAA-like domain-containing protein [Pseudomonadota bacterium]